MILRERKQITCGTTLYVAELVGQLQGSHASMAFASYGVELLREIEAETGLNPGFRQYGSTSITSNKARLVGKSGRRILQNMPLMYCVLLENLWVTLGWWRSPEHIAY